MVEVCNGTKTKDEMLYESIEQYKHVFNLARQQFNRILEVGNYFIPDVYIMYLNTSF